MLNRFESLMGLDYMTEQSALEDILYNGSLDLSIESNGLSCVGDKYYDPDYRVCVNANQVRKATKKSAEYGKDHSPVVSVVCRQGHMKIEESSPTVRREEEVEKLAFQFIEKAVQKRRDKDREQRKIDEENRLKQLAIEAKKEAKKREEEEKRRQKFDNLYRIINADFAHMAIFNSDYDTDRVVQFISDIKNYKYKIPLERAIMPWYVKCTSCSAKDKSCNKCYTNDRLPNSEIDRRIMALSAKINEESFKYPSVEEFIRKGNPDLEEIYISFDLTMENFCHTINHSWGILDYEIEQTRANLVGFLRVTARNLDLKDISEKNYHFYMTIKESYEMLFSYFSRKTRYAAKVEAERRIAEEEGKGD